jgi:hypothetical protein
VIPLHALRRKVALAALLTLVLGGGVIAGFLWAPAERAGGAAAAMAPRGAPIRGAPIRAPGASAPVAGTSGASGATPDSAEKRERDGVEYLELPLSVLTAYDYPRSGSFPGVAAAGAPPVSPTDEARSMLQLDAPPPPATKIPDGVRAWNERRVCVTGFMNPVEFDADGVASFLLTGVPGGCCFGMIPRLNDWVVVTMPEGERTDYAYFDPVTIYGEISIGEEFDGGVIVSLYRMTPQAVEIGD